MQIVSCALALLSGLVGAGFASGREIVRFFLSSGPAYPAAVILSVFFLAVFFLRLCAAMDASGVCGVKALCCVRFGRRFGSLCAGLFFLLFCITAGAMLAACAEICALTLPFAHAYGAGMVCSLLLALLLSLRRGNSLAVCGAALLLVLPVLFFRLLRLDAGEACFYPAMTPELPVRAAADGMAYAALNAALLLGTTPLLLPLDRKRRTRAVFLLCGLFLFLLVPACAVCLRHLQSIRHAPMPFLSLSRRLSGGYGFFALCLYTCALSTLSAMLGSVASSLPFSPGASALAACALCLFFSRMGFSALVQSAYPALGAVCAGLMLLLCA